MKYSWLRDNQDQPKRNGDIAAKPPPQPAASEAELRAVLLDYERWLYDADPSQIDPAMIDRYLAERAARAAEGGGK